jgi:hypothetical protein
MVIQIHSLRAQQQTQGREKSHGFNLSPPIVGQFLGEADSNIFPPRDRQKKNFLRLMLCSHLLKYLFNHYVSLHLLQPFFLTLFSSMRQIK